ncbi:MAG: DsrE/DsrF/DrsH-like family protein [Oligoflexia bacterium]|nr:DsrE/DsrF/DrsH-like family protein [Oligoflexia bacterium]MBF0365580.1 DsrE/DsrF/DrsH-like family protein [Oligoflexia bacterium]
MPDLITLEAKIKELEAQVDTLRASAPDDKLSMVVMSGDLDKLLAAFIIASGGSAMFEQVSMFFTFWAIPALRDPKKNPPAKNFISAMFGKMLPKGSTSLKLSKMHMGGMGTWMIKNLMKEKNVLSLEELIKKAADAGVKIYICEMSMELMGFKKEEMIDYPELKLAGVAKFLSDAGSSKSTLFI